MDWHFSKDEIQSRYFKTGRGTFLWLDWDSASTILTWRFDILELGMCHTLTRTAQVSQDCEWGWFVNNRCTGPYLLDAWDAVFDGLYAEFLQGVYEDLEITLASHDTKDQLANKFTAGATLHATSTLAGTPC